MSNGTRKAQKSIERRRKKMMDGTGTYYAPKIVRDEAARALMLYDEYVDAGHQNAVYMRANTIAHGNALTRKQMQRILDHFEAHQKDRDRKFGSSDEMSVGMIAWMLNGGDPGARWVRALLRGTM